MRKFLLIKSLNIVFSCVSKWSIMVRQLKKKVKFVVTGMETMYHENSANILHSESMNSGSYAFHLWQIMRAYVIYNWCSIKLTFFLKYLITIQRRIIIFPFCSKIIQVSCGTLKTNMFLIKHSFMHYNPQTYTIINVFNFRCHKKLYLKLHIKSCISLKSHQKKNRGWK